MALGRHEARAILLAIGSLTVTIVGTYQYRDPPKPERTFIMPRPRPSAAVSSESPLSVPLSSSAESMTGGGGLSASSRVAGPGGSPADEHPLTLHSVKASVGLPPTHEEVSPDGLPASGLRCSFDGSVFQCGACRTDSDCPAGKGCVANRETRRFECMETECEEDVHCMPGLVCRPVTTGAAGPVIRRCVPSGSRRAGEACDTMFVSPIGACEEGLVCHHGVCSSPCQVDDPKSCPKGDTCEVGLNGAACAPNCRIKGCPEGQRCKSLNETESQCLEKAHGICPDIPCGEGYRCNMRLSRERGVFWCAQTCDPLQKDSCPATHVCGVGSATVSTCYIKCNPRHYDPCGRGWECATVTEDMTQWGCIPIVSE